MVLPDVGSENSVTVPEYTEELSILWLESNSSRELVSIGLYWFCCNIEYMHFME